MKAMLHDDKVALIAAASPFDYDPELHSFAHTLFTQKEALGPTQMIVRVARGAYLAEHRAALVDFMADYLNALHYLVDPAHHDEAVSLVAGMTRQPPAYYTDWLFTKKDYYRNPGAVPDLDVLQANVATQHELGFLTSDLDVKHYADLGIVADAAKALASEPTH
jgi:NitT/TauT family transport system substrate-binding protein